jgi:ParB family transcriptional regulator, chromosome partitioning protein
MSSSSRARQLERLKGQLGGATGHDQLFGGVGSNLPQLIELRVEELGPNPHQPRRHFDPDSIASLAASIERHGLLQPVVVRRREDGVGEGYELVAGERRLRAVRSLGRGTIPALLCNGDAEELGLIENIQRQDLHPLEEAAAIGRLMQRHGYTQEAVGRVIGKPRTTVGEIMALNTLPDWLQEEAGSRPVARHLLVQLARIDDVHEQKAAWEAVKNGASVRAIKARRAASVAAAGSAIGSAERALAAAHRSVWALGRLPVEDLMAAAEPRTTLLELRHALDEIIARLDGG